MKSFAPTALSPRPAGYFDYGVNAFLLGSEFTIMHSYKAVFVLGSLVLLGACLVFNIFRMGGIRPTGFRFGVAAVLGACLLIANIFIMAGQNGELEGVKAAIKVFINEAAFMAMLTVCVWRYAPKYLHPTLVTVAVAIACFAGINLVADRLGIGIGVLSDRATTFESRFEVGTYRWQAPLYSSWQLSGLLRWAVPLMLVHLWKYSRHRWKEMSLVGTSLLLSTAIMVICEYRAAVFPLAGALLWVTVTSNRVRVVLGLSFIGYALAVPFIITQDWVGQFLQENTPAIFLQLAGNQDILGVLTLSGRSVMWQNGLEVLASGKYFWLGEGHVLMNAAKDIGGQDASSAQLFSRIGYHQGLLDVLFIYGVVPGMALICGLLGGVLRGLNQTFRRTTTLVEADDISFAVFSLGMIALSNCHDGFLLEHNVFYFLCIISLCAVSDSAHQAAVRSKQGLRPDIRLAGTTTMGSCNGAS